LSPDFRDLIAAFNAEGVEYLIVGAHALAAHGVVRATKDLDVWTEPTAVNANAMIRCIARRSALMARQV
jgi:catalase